MNALINQIEKMKPFFDKISQNIYLRAIRDGFIATMPVVLFSSLFMLIAYVPNIWGFHWSPEVESLIVKPYNYSMGILGFLVAGTTAKALTDSYNRSMPKTNQINSVSTMLASMVVFLLLAADGIEGGFARAFMGSTGLLTSFLSAFMTVKIYHLCIKNNITIRLPEEVPPNISQTFKDVIPFAITVILGFGLDQLVRYLNDTNLAQFIIELFQPLFQAADGWIGLALIYGAYSLFWFVGIHGPSIVEPAISAVQYLNLDNNLALLQAGEQATNLLTPGTQMFIVTMGGTGATLVIPFMFMWLAKSKQNKAVGKASVIPTFFGVNEPILFGGPLVLNPIFFIPFVLAPIVNVWIFKIFVEVLGMNSFSYFLPWTTPAPLGLVLGTGVSWLAVILAILLIVVDVAIYYPFFRVYDKQILEREKAEELMGDNVDRQNLSQPTTKEMVEERVETVEVENIGQEINVLVICAGGGTSGLLANALKKGAKQSGEPIDAAAGTYGAHQDIMGDYDLIILAPQVASNYDVIKQDADRLGVKLVKTGGKEYIDLTRNPEGALEFVRKQFT